MRPAHFRFVVLVWLLLGACRSTSKPEPLREDLRACQETTASLRLELTACQSKALEDLHTVANQLEVLAAATSRPTLASNQPLDSVEFSPSIPLAGPPEYPTIERINALALAVRERFDQIEQEMIRQVADLKASSAADFDATSQELRTIQAQNEELKAQLSRNEVSTSEVESLRQELATEKRRMRQAVRAITNRLREFDNKRITCRTCGFGFSDAFGREIINLHMAVRAELDATDDLSADP